MLNFTFPKFKILIIFKIYVLKIIYLFSYFLFSIDPMRIKCLHANVSRLIRNFSIVRLFERAMEPFSIIDLKDEFSKS